ncbi:MAG: hypothetical protein R2856_36135 [Caldilineaceae bacterium]
MTLLRRDAALNLYPLGNMASLGFDSEICQFWGDFGADGRVRGVLNRYMTGWVIYGLPDADWPALASGDRRSPAPGRTPTGQPRRRGLDLALPASLPCSESKRKRSWRWTKRTSASSRRHRTQWCAAPQKATWPICSSSTPTLAT